MSVTGILKGHDLFQSLGQDQARAIANFSSVKECEAGMNIFALGDPGSHVYMLMDGSVNLRLPATDGDFSLVISRIEQGELFGLSPLLDSPVYTATAQCAEPTKVLAIEAKAFRRLLKDNALVGFDIMNRVAHIYFSRYIYVLKSLQNVVGQVSLIR
jgi:CRP-like cAMP-binding protein